MKHLTASGGEGFTGTMRTGDLCDHVATYKPVTTRRKRNKRKRKPFKTGTVKAARARLTANHAKRGF